jgi:hypothetical protein
LKKILIIYPHFPPSNLAGVHRARLFAQHLPAFGWQPTVLCVHENYYEEKLDHQLTQLLPKELEIFKVKAIKRIGPIGDIGLRAFFQLYKKAKELLFTKQFDFVYIPIPSFYCALLGRMLFAKYKVPYGIDYIDPWVHFFPGSEKVFSRHWFSTRLAKILEPIAIKKAALITGVSELYYSPVLERNPHLKANCITGAMPYGGEERDHMLLNKLNLRTYLFSKNEKMQLVYAGAMLPKAYGILESIFKNISENLTDFVEVEFHFIGTGFSPNDINSFNIKPLAQKYNLWENQVFEYPARIPYLDVLAHLEIADAVFILGSTEPHYTPSKVYQAVLSQKPIFAVLHEKSSAAQIIDSTNAGITLTISEQNFESVLQKFYSTFAKFKCFAKRFNPQQVNRTVFDAYSAKMVTKTLADLLNKVIR